MSDSTSPASASSVPDVQMGDDAVAEYLQSAGDGVLTLHTDDPRSIPVSFGYDVETDRCVFQLLSAGDGAAHPGGETPATLVAYDVGSPDDWASVVVNGVLARIPEPSPDEQRTYAEQATSVGLSVFDADPAVLDAAWYELRPTDATGRRSP